MTDTLRNEPQQERSSARLKSLDVATRTAIGLVGRERVTTAMIAELAVPRASIGTVYRYGRDRLFWLNRVQPVATHGVEAVLELHQPTGVATASWCAGATLCSCDRQFWPCDTVLALTLEPEQAAAACAERDAPYADHLVRS